MALTNQSEHTHTRKIRLKMLAIPNLLMVGSFSAHNNSETNRETGNRGTELRRASWVCVFPPRRLLNALFHRDLGWSSEKSRLRLKRRLVRRVS